MTPYNHITVDPLTTSPCTESYRNKVITPPSPLMTPYNHITVDSLMTSLCTELCPSKVMNDTLSFS